MSQTLISRLVSVTQEISYPNMSASAVSVTKQAILDSLGCAIAAVGCEPARIAGKTLHAQPGRVSVIGELETGGLERAILLNGILLRYLDMMDVYWAQDVCHPSENVPVALASVEAEQGSGAKLLEVVAAAYEAQMRLTHLFALNKLGMHHVSASGIVAPLAIGKAWGLDPAVIERAVALGGCKQFTIHAMSKGGLSMAKAIGYAWSAMESVLAVNLARNGFTGPADFLDWIGIDSPAKHSFDLSALGPLDDLLITKTSFKQFPVQFELQTPNEVAIRAYQQIAGRAIKSVKVSVPPVAAKRTADPAKFKPNNRETADHSLPVTVAMSLLDGRLTPGQFERDRWRDSDVVQLVQKIMVSGEEHYVEKYPKGRPAKLVVELADGTILEDFQSVPFGDATRPMDDQAIEQKFLANVVDAIGLLKAQAIIDCVRGLQDMANISELTQQLRFKPNTH